MKVKFSNETKNDFRNYKEHLQKLKNRTKVIKKSHRKNLWDFILENFL